MNPPSAATGMWQADEVFFKKVACEIDYLNFRQLYAFSKFSFHDMFVHRFRLLEVALSFAMSDTGTKGIFEPTIMNWDCVIDNVLQGESMN